MKTSQITRAFLGEEAGWQAASLALEDVQPLWGGQRVSITGRGRVLAEAVSADGKEKHGYLHLPAAEAQALLALCCEQDILALPPSPRPGLPDEARPQITLTNPAGESQSVAAWAGAMDDRLAAVYTALQQLGKQALAVTATEQRLAELAAQWDEKGYALDRFSHQPHVVTQIEKEIAGLESQIAAHRQTLDRLTASPAAKKERPS